MNNCFCWLGFDSFADSSEGFWIVDGKLGKNFAVEFDVFLLHAIDKKTVADAVFASSIIDTSDPKAAKIAFAIAAIAIAVAEGFNNTLLG